MILRSFFTSTIKLDQLVTEINEIANQCNVLSGQKETQNSAMTCDDPVNVTVVFNLRHGARTLLGVSVVYDNSIHLERKSCELIPASDKDLANFICVLPHFGNGVRMNVKSTGCFLNETCTDSGTNNMITTHTADALTTIPVSLLDSRGSDNNPIKYNLEFDLVRHSANARSMLCLDNSNFFRLACSLRQKLMTLQHRLAHMHSIPVAFRKQSAPLDCDLSNIDSVADAMVHINMKIKHAMQDCVQSFPVANVKHEVLGMFEHADQNLWTSAKSYQVTQEKCDCIPDTFLPKLYSWLGLLLNLEHMSGDDIAECSKMFLSEDSELQAFCQNHKLLMNMRTKTLYDIEKSRHSDKRVVPMSRALFVLLRAIDNVICCNVHACYDVAHSRQNRGAEPARDLRAAILRHRVCEMLLQQILRTNHTDFASVPYNFFDNVRTALHNVQDVLHCLPNCKSTMLPCVAKSILSCTIRSISKISNEQTHARLCRENSLLHNKMRVLPVATKLHFTYSSRRSDVLTSRLENMPIDNIDEDFYKNCLDMYLEIIHASHDTYDISRHVMLDAFNYIQNPETVQRDGQFTAAFERFVSIFTPSMRNFVKYVNAPAFSVLSSNVFEVHNPLFAFVNGPFIFNNEAKMAFTIDLIMDLFTHTDPKISSVACK